MCSANTSLSISGFAKYSYMRRRRIPSPQMLIFTAVVIVFLLFYGNTGILSIRNTKIIPLNVKNRLCAENFNDVRLVTLVNKTALKTIYFVTPTYPRPTQIPELVRLSHTLMHIPNLHWIVADDQQSCSEEVLNVLSLSGLPYTHIASPKPFLYKTANFPRGVANRLAALYWIREHSREGILYFGDDDNTYDLRLFEEIRKVKRVGMLPVGLMGNYGVSSPVIGDGKVVAFYDSWPGDRTFPVDMAGFAVNIAHMPPNATMPYKEGFEEDKFLISLGIKMEHIEPLADNCSKIYVWHTKTVERKVPEVKIHLERFAIPKYESFVKLLKETVSLGMAIISPGNGTKIVKNRKTYDVISGLP